MGFETEPRLHGLDTTLVLFVSIGLGNNLIKVDAATTEEPLKNTWCVA